MHSILFERGGRKNSIKNVREVKKKCPFIHLMNIYWFSVMSLLSVVLKAGDSVMNETEKNTNYSLRKFTLWWEELINSKTDKEIYQTISNHKISSVITHWGMRHRTQKDCAWSRGTAWDELVTDAPSGKSWELKGEKEPGLHKDEEKSYQAKGTDHSHWYACGPSLVLCLQGLYFFVFILDGDLWLILASKLRAEVICIT